MDIRHSTILKGMIYVTLITKKVLGNISLSAFLRLIGWSLRSHQHRPEIFVPCSSPESVTNWMMPLVSSHPFDWSGMREQMRFQVSEA